MFHSSCLFPLFVFPLYFVCFPVVLCFVMTHYLMCPVCLFCVVLCSFQFVLFCLFYLFHFVLFLVFSIYDLYYFVGACFILLCLSCFE